MAEFDELKLTVTLADNATAGLQRIRQELGLLTQSASQMQTAFAGATKSIDTVTSAAQKATPAAANLNKEMASLGKSSADLGRGLKEVGMSLSQGLGGIPMAAAGIKNMAGAVTGISSSLSTLAPNATMAALAIGGIAVGVVAVGAAIALVTVTVFRFSREMAEINKTAKSMGVTFAELKTATDHARQFNLSTETAIQNIAGLQKAQTDLSLNNSELRNKALSLGVDPGFVNRMEREVDVTKRYNAVREYGLQLQKDLIQQGYTPGAARGHANNFAAMWGQDAGIYDRGAMKPPTDKMNEVGRVSTDIEKSWGKISESINNIKFDTLSRGLPYLLSVLQSIEGVMDRLEAKMKDADKPAFKDESFAGHYLRKLFGGDGSSQDGATAPARPANPYVEDFKKTLKRMSFNPDEDEKTERNTEETERLTAQIERLNFNVEGGANARGGGGIPGLIKANYSPSGGDYGGTPGTPGAGSSGLPAGTRGTGSSGLPAGIPQGAGGKAVGKEADRIAVAKAAMEAQLRKEGVPEANVKEAANLLAGQGLAESGLNPNASHDSGTGYGIYGARDPQPGRGRRTDMLNWLKENGYEPNSLAGQAAYMAHEAMTGKGYGATRGALLGADEANRGRNTDIITRNFEAPRINNDATRRGTTNKAAGVTSNSNPTSAAGAEGDDSLKGRLAGLNAVTADMREAGLDITSGYRDPSDRLSRANPHSAHSRGLAFDTRARSAEQADAAIAKIKETMAAKGLQEGRDYKILDEVRHPSGWATGPHVHTQLTQEGMRRYVDRSAVDKQNGGAVASKGTLSVKVDHGANDKVEYNGNGLLKPTEMQTTRQMEPTRYGHVSDEGGWL